MRTLTPLWMTIVCLLGGVPWTGAGALTVTDLRCEGRRAPLGIDVARPCLSWVLQTNRRGDAQTAYQVLVADSAVALNKDQGTVWDSGKVASSSSIQVALGGEPLLSGKAYHWKVRAWDRQGEPSAWSAPATWEMGLMGPRDWQAQWLNDGKSAPAREVDFYKDDPAPLFRKPFALARPVARARLFISGLGYYEASLNGRRVGDYVLDPGWTNYAKRVFYSTYDVTGQLRQGDNCLGVTLGNGWYNPLPLRLFGKFNFREVLPVGRPRFIARLEVEFTDGTRQAIVSDPTWKVSDGPIRFNNVYLGEVYDARREAAGWDRPGFDDAAWRRPSLAGEPIGPLQSQPQPPIRVLGKLGTVKLSEPKPGVFIFDLGQNFAGVPTLSLSAPAGTKVVLRYGELLNADGTLNPLTSVAGQIKWPRKNKDGKMESSGGPGAPLVAWQTDTYFARGEGVETYTPRFTFHGFRYVELTGFPGRVTPGTIAGLRMSADVERVGEFDCSNEMFNRIQKMCDWTFLSNLFSVQSDCPQREKLGYGGDVVGVSEAFMMNYDMAAFYVKTVRDWQDSAAGGDTFFDTAPYVGIGYCGLVWGMVHPLLQRQLRQYYGERALIGEQYETSKRWLDRYVAQNPDLVIKEGLSDHETLVPAPQPAMINPWFVESARLVSELGRDLGRGAEADHYGSLAEKIREAYLKNFFDAQTGKLGPANQAAQSAALYLDLVPAGQRAAVFKVLLEDLAGRGGHLSTGLLGTRTLLDVLSREGRADLAYDVVNQKAFPGWGYMLENGATTLWEHWAKDEKIYSHNHPMFGSVSQWFFHWLGGIQPDRAAEGFDRVVIRPQPVQGLDWVRCSYASARGRIVSNWRREPGKLSFEVEIPVGVTALVYLPADRPEQVREGGRPLAQTEGVEFVQAERGAVACRVGAGRYAFAVAAGAR